MAILSAPDDFLGQRQVERENRFAQNKAHRATIEQARAEALAKRESEGQPPKAAANTPPAERAFKLNITTEFQQARIQDHFDNQKKGESAGSNSPNASKLAELREQSDEIFARHANDDTGTNLTSIDQEG